jgi:hypothetical protein
MAEYFGVGHMSSSEAVRAADTMICFALENMFYLFMPKEYWGADSADALHHSIWIDVALG